MQMQFGFGAGRVIQYIERPLALHGNTLAPEKLIEIHICFRFLL